MRHVCRGEHTYVYTAFNFSFCCFYTNAQSFINKREELHNIISEREPDIIGITESWCNPDILDSEITIAGYDLFRKDRILRGGGGVLLFIKTRYGAILNKRMEDYNIEDTLFCDITLGKKDKLLIGIIYRSPNLHDDLNAAIFNQIQKMEDTDSSHILLFGDFNFPEINWRNETVSVGRHHPANIFLNIIQEQVLHQKVQFATRHRDNQLSSLLDLVFSNEDNMIDYIEHTAPLGKSDHDCLVWTYLCYSEKNYSDEGTGTVLNYKKANLKKLRQAFSAYDWSLLNSLPCIEAWHVFKSVYYDNVKKYVPIRDFTKKTKPPWLRGNVKKSLRNKNALYKTYRRTKRLTDYIRYKEQRNVTLKIVRDAQMNYEKDIIKGLKSNSKRFYNYIRSKQKVKAGISRLTKEDGSLTENDIETAGVLAKFFNSVFTKDTTNEMPTSITEVVPNKVTQCIITIDEVMDHLLSLNKDKCPGEDNIHPSILADCAEQLAIPLLIIFRKSLEQGVLPDDWKIARISPIYKNGLRTNAGNYRPVSLTRVPCKILESIVRDRLVRHLDQNNVVTSPQHGFVKRKSCVTNLLEFMEDATFCLDNGYGVDVIFLDFSKAFDTVPHKRLLFKLKSFGIEGSLLSWITDFLNKRRQFVSVRGSTSDCYDVLSGVPQGSVLGPILFILYVNDLPDVVFSEIKMFADDTKIYNRIINTEDCLQLQEDLDNLQEWSDLWGLNFNAGKCKVMHIGTNNQAFNYKMKGTDLKKITEEKDLGVYISNDLKPSRHTHCAKAAKKASSSLGIVKRTFKYLDEESLALCINSYIRPHLEYCIQAWRPYFRKDIEVLDRVLRRSTKILPRLRHLSYDERLSALQLPSLEQRWDRGDLIETFKILKGFENVERSTFFKFSETNTRGNNLKLFKPHLKKGILVRKNFYSQRVINGWNALTNTAVDSIMVSAFKRAIDNIE